MIRWALAGATALAGCTVSPPAAIGGPALIVEGEPWRVIAVNGRATPPNGDYFVQFERSNVSAKFGCNSMGGTYRVESDGRIVVPQLAQTLIGCPEPSMSFETQGARVFQAPMRTLHDGDRVTLSSSGGTIALSRPYRP